MAKTVTATAVKRIITKGLTGWEAGKLVLQDLIDTFFGKNSVLSESDMTAIRIGDIHFDRNTIATRNRKAGKAMAERPLPGEIMTGLSNYVTTLPDGQERLFSGDWAPPSRRTVDETRHPTALMLPPARTTPQAVSHDSAMATHYGPSSVLIARRSSIAR